MSRTEAPSVLIAASSGRSLAASARRAGYVPLVADWFNDHDTDELAAAVVRVSGFTRRTLLPALARLSSGRAPVGLVCGSGFERRPNLLRALAERHRLLGNSAEVVARVKNPVSLAALCRRLDIPHPNPERVAGEGGAFLCKQIGACGGGHVQPAISGQVAPRGRYMQRRVGGTPVSALFLADGNRALLLGTSRQWTDPTPGSPYRYGGAARPAGLDAEVTRGLGDAVVRLAEASGLRGLNSADFLVREDGFDLIEVNPRPGATLDIFVDTRGALFQHHLDACSGLLPAHAPFFGRAAAACVVYAPRVLVVPADMAWPGWTADRERGGVVPEGAPLCTVVAEADDADHAERQVRARAEVLLAMMGSPQ